jgi:hypothetical protein
VQDRCSSRRELATGQMKNDCSSARGMSMLPTELQSREYYVSVSTFDDNCV